MASFAQNCLVDQLAANVSLRCVNPASQNTFQPADIVAMMDRELSLGIVPLMKKLNQSYMVMNVDRTISQGTSAYTFPPRAVGNALRDVVLLDASGNEVSLNNLEREYIKVQFPFNFVPSIYSFGQYLTANEVNLWNTLIQTYTAYSLRFICERRPGGLTLSTNCGQITAITGNVLTLSNVDSTWTTNTTFDIINDLPPFQSIVDDATITNISGSQITLSTVPTGIAKNQWVCPAMLSCIPQIPYEYFALLEERTVAVVAEALDMSQLLASANARIKEFTDNAAVISRPRLPGSPKVIVNRSAFPSRGFGGVGGGWR
jgi:hypothetical protein